ncbi:MAG: hypothetical protein OET44_13120 [Gammaproteobacteria bacterium]|nr:hypothetical protein [Gammaproteobacteria bacterium]
MATHIHYSNRGALLGLLLILPVALQAATVDATAPVVQHDPVASEVGAGTPLTISATVTDNVGVAKVTLFYRARGESDYQRLAMKRIGNTDMFIATLDTDDVREPAFEYYIEAGDAAGNILLVGYALSPLIVSVTESRFAATEEPAPPPPEAKSGAKRATWLWVLMGVGVAALAVGAGGGGGSSDSGGVSVNGPLPQ